MADKITKLPEPTSSAWTASDMQSGNLRFTRYGKLRILTFDDVKVASDGSLTINTMSDDKPVNFTAGVVAGGGISYAVWLRTNGTWGHSPFTANVVVNGQVVWCVS